jgi:hypothetical protein
VASVLPRRCCGDAEDNAALLIPYALIAATAALTLIREMPSVRAALVAAIPALSALGIAVVGGLLVNDANAEERGETLLLYYGVALWTSWGVLVLLTAAICRTRWWSMAGGALTLPVALLGIFLFCARID